MRHTGHRHPRSLSRRMRALATVLCTVSVAACSARTAAPDIAARIDPVSLPLAELPYSDVAWPPARAELVRLVDSLTNDVMFTMAHWGIMIVDPEVGDTLVSVNADKLFMPASNQKLITGAAALAILGKEYVWRTPVLMRGSVRNGILTGDLVIVGSGDPSWSEALRDGNALQALQPIVDALQSRGIRRVNGTIRIDGDVFPDAQLGWGWSWDDLDFPYSAGADDVMFNENFYRVIVRGGARAGAPVMVRTEPLTEYPSRTVEAITRAANDSLSARVAPLTALSDSVGDRLVVRGSIAAGDSLVLTRAYRHPNDAVRAALRELLSAHNIQLVPPRTRIISRTAAPDACCTNRTADTLTVLVSPPLRDVHTRLQKPSQNQLAEAMFKTIARERTGVGTADSAQQAVMRQLAEWGIPETAVIVRDGSGLSRHNYVSPRALARLLTVMQAHPSFPSFYAALPVAGVDGTIASRMKGTPAQGNLRAKTGTLDRARSLSGYVTTADGHQLIFSMLCNNWAGSVRDVERVQDAIGVYLASVAMADLRRVLPSGGL
jgi:D-alanyl-D-alanine carboxypeptidase/D-alanyl-D-alanine-endopeptidase (penicillin-binding protein 4)